MQVDVLGTIHVQVDDASIEIAAKKPRALLAFLAMHAGQVVSTDDLIDGLWGEESPDSAANAIQVYVAGLRRTLGQARDRLRTRAPGYTLDIDRDAVDALRFEDALRGDTADAAIALTDALALWRGTPFEDLGEVPFAEP